MFDDLVCVCVVVGLLCLLLFRLLTLFLFGRATITSNVLVYVIVDRCWCCVLLLCLFLRVLWFLRFVLMGGCVCLCCCVIACCCCLLLVWCSCCFVGDCCVCLVCLLVFAVWGRVLCLCAFIVRVRLCLFVLLLVCCCFGLVYMFT